MLHLQASKQESRSKLPAMKRSHSPASQDEQEEFQSAGASSKMEEEEGHRNDDDVPLRQIEQARQQQRLRLDRARRWWLHGVLDEDRYRGADDAKEDNDNGGPGHSSLDGAPTVAMEGMAWLEGVHRDIWKTTDGGGCPTPEQVLAGERLALLLLQTSSERIDSEDRTREADAILDQLGYACRLARNVLNYPDDTTGPPATAPYPSSLSSILTRPCSVWDDFLPRHLLAHLQNVFGNPHASYWTDHNYQIEPHPSPYFSYLVPLPSDLLQNSPPTHGGNHRFESEFGGLGSVIALAWRALAEWKGRTVASSATYCEMWAHNRPGSTGHQLHWDTDNEGRDATSIRHPIATAIVCLHPGSGLLCGGGPTFVTHQRLAATTTSAISNGWLVCPTTNRLILMDGRVLHGVVPGKLSNGGGGGGNCDSRDGADGNRSSHRVTVMLAFWKRIRCRRDEPGWGAARPFPSLPPRPDWASQLLLATAVAGSPSDEGTTTPSPSEPRGASRVPGPVSVAPHPVSHSYERVPDGAPWKNGAPLPSYDRIFQGV